eukprot:CAMPEP_0184695530 /NCGR_PEP_ID=MMETSP0313-20130426/3139_1 /TAXON_ID=2792 /ORGANISM="Porphyridium aerugineum, Strain SAG 1380-2" /LENGTH=143 /DNA_ID=CAMNT_0027154011 /DNA_START=40 /DNA_END=468 /DNA_ORIENTATION=-
MDQEKSSSHPDRIQPAPNQSQPNGSAPHGISNQQTQSHVQHQHVPVVAAAPNPPQTEAQHVIPTQPPIPYAAGLPLNPQVFHQVPQPQPQLQRHEKEYDSDTSDVSSVTSSMYNSAMSSQVVYRSTAQAHTIANSTARESQES